MCVTFQVHCCLHILRDRHERIWPAPQPKISRPSPLAQDSHLPHLPPAPNNQESIQVRRQTSGPYLPHPDRIHDGRYTWKRPLLKAGTTAETSAGGAGGASAGALSQPVFRSERAAFPREVAARAPNRAELHLGEAGVALLSNDTLPADCGKKVFLASEAAHQNQNDDD